MSISMFRFSVKSIFKSVGAVFAIASVSFAGDNLMPIYILGSNGIAKSWVTLVDFSTTRQMGPWPTLSGGQKYQELQLMGDGCYEIQTMSATTSNVDTRIWLKTGTAPVSDFVSLSDDIIPGIYQSFGRIWFESTFRGDVKVAFSPYSSYSNSIDFTYSITNVGLSREHCGAATGPVGSDPVPYATFINGTLSFVRRN